MSVRIPIESMSSSLSRTNSAMNDSLALQLWPQRPLPAETSSLLDLVITTKRGLTSSLPRTLKLQTLQKESSTWPFQLKASRDKSSINPRSPKSRLDTISWWTNAKRILEETRSLRTRTPSSTRPRSASIRPTGSRKTSRRSRPSSRTSSCSISQISMRKNRWS